MELKRWRLRFLSWTLTAVSRGLMLRDRWLRVTERLPTNDLRETFFLASGTRNLACVYLPGSKSGPAVLVCHGIGETVEHWSSVQAMFHDHGIGSLVFNYSGYGKSSGPVRVEYCNEDLVSAHAELRRRVGPAPPVFVLGFSLGGGIAAQGASALRPPIAGLFLCETFDSFREAACAAGVPRWLVRAVPDVWTTVAAMGRIQMPVWVVHSDGDQLFPLEMARRITSACGPWGELIVVESLAHNEPYLTAAETYWWPVRVRIQGMTARLGDTPER